MRAPFARVRVYPVISITLLTILLALPLAGAEPATPASEDQKAAATGTQPPAPAIPRAVSPTPDERPAGDVPSLAGTYLETLLRRDTARVPIVRDAAGVKIIDTRQSFRNVYVMTIGPDGKPVMACIASIEAAEAMVKAQRELEKAP
jgi:hypothetical protein